MEAICELGNYSYSLNEMWSDEADFMAQLMVSNSVNNVPCNESTAGFMQQYHQTSLNGITPFQYNHHDDGIVSNYINHHHAMTSMDHDHHVMMSMSEEEEEESNKSMSHEDEAPIRVEYSKKKRSRIHGDIPVPRSKRGTGAKRPKIDENNYIHMMNSSSSICSEDTNSSCSGATAKTRAGRGSATDPQSLYARKRRERINERLKVLQKLVPNGTKVDISTMLEEAVQYVKFLQLQIKLLSSDDMWMYAPIAYNGMDLGALHSKISSPKPQF